MLKNLANSKIFEGKKNRTKHVSNKQLTIKDLSGLLSRYTILKFIFLLASIAVLAIIFFAIYPKNNQFSNSIKKTKDPEQQHLKNYKLNIKESIFEGITKDSLPYKIIANNLKKIDESLYEINAINVKYPLENQSITIQASSGIVNDSEKLISLKNNVKLEFNEVNFQTQAIELNLNTNDAATQYPVLVMYKDSKIESNNFNTEDSTNQINFEGNVRSTFQLKDFQ